MAAPKLKKRLGDLLVEEQIINESDLLAALEKQKSSGRKLGAVLIESGVITEEQLLRFLAQQLNVPFLDISNWQIDERLAGELSEVHARRLRVIILESGDEHVMLGMSDPADLSAIEQLSSLLSPKRLEIVAVRESQILTVFDGLYRRTKEIEEFASQLQAEYEQSEDFNFATLEVEGEADTVVAKLLKSLFEDAVQVRASDIHIEPDRGSLRIRTRVDGVLQESILREVNIAPALVLRLKLMAGLDISEKRVPQDGRFQVKVKGHEIDVRISTMPIQDGESVVMRLLDQSAGLLSLTSTGMPPHILAKVRKLVKSPNGMFLVTGPTGSGKTTTLYGCLSELNSPDNKIITVEDPVEYRLPRINQVQINTKIELTFSSVLRTALRQDPDIIMVGEIRDQETAEIGLRAALTGHMVLSTLHTNDAVSTALRLIDMGAAPYLVASSLRAVLAQRLVRRICTSCKVEHKPETQMLTWVSNIAGIDKSDITFYRGSGCQTCNNTGYKGRIGVYELLEMSNEALITALRNGDTDAFAKAAKAIPDYKTLGQTALELAEQGITSIQEVLRISEVVSDTATYQ
jgi:MSHA biogenesis protein MshE